MEVFFLILTAPPLDDVNRVGYDSCPLFLSLSTVNRKQILESEVCNGSLGDRKLDRHRTSLATAKHYDSHTNENTLSGFLNFTTKQRNTVFYQSIDYFIAGNKTNETKN